MTATLPIPATLEEQIIERQPLCCGDPCTMTIFGAGGDLTRRKLIPALYHLMGDGLLHEDFAVLAVARDAMSEDDYRAAMRQAVSEHGTALDDIHWKQFAKRILYVRGDVGDEATYAAIRDRLTSYEEEHAALAGRLFYLALPPAVFPTVIGHLSRSALAPRTEDPAARPWARVIIEKPFGTSLRTARELNALVTDALAEGQIYRIDHYLGKETVQNLIVLRFANSIFEPVWNRQHIHHVQITAAERVGVEDRAGYYDRAGVVRDMMQNHLLQLLSLTAMEPPVAFDAEHVRSEKAKLLAAVRPVEADEIDRHAVRGQYGPGLDDGRRLAGYRQESGVAEDSVTPTFAALRLMIDNWRWQGVPFFLRSGKRLPVRATEIAIRFREPPHLLFPVGPQDHIAPNELVVRIQPSEGMSLSFMLKVPGLGVRMVSAKMDFTYDETFGPERHSAYETLLLDAMTGDATLFLRSDSVEVSWRIVDPVIDAWAVTPPRDFPNYRAGSWGPSAADELIARDGGIWRQPSGG